MIDIIASLSIEDGEAQNVMLTNNENEIKIDFETICGCCGLTIGTKMIINIEENT